MVESKDIIRDLKRQNEDLLAEQEILYQTTSEQLFQIETLRAQLELHKQNAPFAQEQATLKLEGQLFEINEKLETTERALTNKNCELAEMKSELDRINQILEKKDMEISNVIKSGNDAMEKINFKLEETLEENRLLQDQLKMKNDLSQRFNSSLQAKLNVQKNNSNGSQLFDTLLSDKNHEIDYLRQELFQRTKQLEIFESLNKAKLQDLSELDGIKSPKTQSLNEILSHLCEILKKSSENYRSQSPQNLKISTSVVKTIIKLFSLLLIEVYGENDRVDNGFIETVRRKLNFSPIQDQQHIINSTVKEVQNCNEDAKKIHENTSKIILFDDLDTEKDVSEVQVTENDSYSIQLKYDETNEIIKLEEKLSKKIRLIKSLKLQLQKERAAAKERQTQDTELINMLRIKLTEALELKDKLTVERQSIANSFHNQSNFDVSVIITPKKQRSDKEKLELQHLKNSKCQEIMTDSGSENVELQNQNEIVEIEIVDLPTDPSQTELKKVELKSDLLKAKEELQAKIKTNESQKIVVQTLCDTSQNQNQSFNSIESKNLNNWFNNNEEFSVYSKSNIRSLKRMLKRCMEIIMDQQKELRAYLEREIELVELIETEKWTFDTYTTPIKILPIIKGLDEAAKKFSQDKVYLYKKITELKEENKKYLNQIKSIESQQILNDENSSDSDKNITEFDTKDTFPDRVSPTTKGLQAAIKKLTQDKITLYEKMAQLREENERYQNQIKPFESHQTPPFTCSTNNNSMISTAKESVVSDEKFAKLLWTYLRCDSRRKALIFQKNYLLCVVSSYQRAERKSLAVLSDLTMSEHTAKGKNRKISPRLRFRSMVFLIISTERMKWLILRRQTGIRTVNNTVYGFDIEN